MTLKQFMRVPLAVIFLLTIPPVYSAEEGTVQAIIPWEGDGRVFQVGTNTVMFLGSLKGVMYIENATGEMHEALVLCPVKQEIDMETGSTEAVGRCEITVSADSVAYAKLSCQGRPGECAGDFTLIDGEGKLTGIKGTGKLSVRSPMRTIIADMPTGAVLRVASGLAVIKDMKFSIP